MNTIELFSAIYHNDLEKIKLILDNSPELINRVFEDDNLSTNTNELYYLCDLSTLIKDPKYLQENALLF